MRCKCRSLIMDNKINVIFIMFFNLGLCYAYGDISCPAKCASCDFDGVCSKCTDGFYGSSCEKQCLANCKTCSQNSSCEQCIHDFYLNKEKRKCIPCSKTCIRSSKDSLCNRLNGNCENGCFTGMYGPQCDKHCPTNCRQNVCDQHTAACTTGCKEGFSGDHCTITEKGRTIRTTRGITMPAANDSKDKNGGEHFMSGWIIILIVLLMVIVAMCTYIIISRRNNRPQTSQPDKEPPVAYARENTERGTTTYQQSASQCAPQPEHMYDSVRDENYRVNISNESTYDSGYLVPTSQNQSPYYLDLVDDSDQRSVYETLNHSGITNK